MTSRPKVSICIPAYKQIDFLKKCLGSVKEQRFSNYEIIISDDTPGDSVKKCVESFNFGPKLTYVHNQPALGSPENWNKAISLASGEYIKILHHDDWFASSDSLAKFVTLLDNNPKAHFGFSANYIWRKNETKYDIHRPTQLELLHLKENPEYLFMKNSIGNPSTTIYRRSVTQKYNKAYKWVVDFEFYIQILKKYPNFAYTPEPLLFTPHQAKHQVTQEFMFNKDLELGEYIDLFNGLKKTLPLSSFKPLWLSLFKLYQITSFEGLKSVGSEKFQPKNYFDSIIKEVKAQKNRRGLFSALTKNKQGSKIASIPQSKDSTFIFTEVYNCGKIGRIALESFVKHHPGVTVYVFSTPEDFQWIIPKKEIIFIDMAEEKNILKGFAKGHLGTARLWAKIIQERPEKYLIHFDSDAIFRANCLADIQKPLRAGYDLVGYIRNYKHNPNNRNDVRHLADVVQTAFFGFNTRKISSHSYNELVKMCQGAYNPLKHPVIDFFDPVSFEIIKNGGKVQYLSPEDYGGSDSSGQRSKNNYADLNKIIDFGRKFIHFAAVGSGMNFYENKGKKRGVSLSYQAFALGQYALFSKLFYNETISYPYDTKKYQQLKKFLNTN